MGESNWSQHSNSELIARWEHCMEGLVEGVSTFLSSSNEATPLTCKLIKNQLEYANQLELEIRARIQAELTKSGCFSSYRKRRGKLPQLQACLRNQGILDLAKETILKLQSPVYSRSRQFRPIKNPKAVKP